MTNVQVRCPICKGKGEVEEHVFDPHDPLCFRFVPCLTCNGFGVLIATELMRVTKWEAVRPEDMQLPMTDLVTGKD